MKKTDFFTTDDGAKIAFFCWLPEEEPIAVVQIAHGMAEYAERYEDFANFLNKHRIAVYANDHRGHGKTAGSVKNLGYFADKNGWIKVVTDMRSLTRIIRVDYPKAPLFLLGHSMGSFLARTYITLYDDINGVILSGTAAYPKPLVIISRIMAFIQLLSRNGKGPSHFLHKMAFNSFNKYFDECENAWLCSDVNVVKEYNENPFSGFVCSLSMYKDLFYGLYYISRKEHNQWIRFTLPVYIVSGSEDLLGDKGKGAKKVGEMYRSRQLEEVSVNIFEDARHEILNETNRQLVYEDLLEWITYHI